MDLKPMTRKEIFLQKIIDNTAMGGVTINNQDKTITENGTYTADEGYTGLGTVTVDVQSGGGGDEASVLDSLIDGSIREITSDVTSVRQYVFYNCPNLTTANFPLAKSVGPYAFYNCSNLTTANFPLVTNISSNALYNCSNLTTANFSLAKSVGQYAFYNCLSLTTANFPLVTSISSNGFYSCNNLTTVILRSKTMVTLSNANAFNSTPIKSGTGYIYVPRALLSDTDSTKDYRQATNWSTYATQFRALEDYTVDGTITGELDPTKI